MRQQLTLFDTPIVTVDPLGTVILILQRTRFGIERKVNMSRIDVKADKTLLSLNAKIMDSPEMKQLIGLDGSITRDISRLALPSIFRFGAYVVPMSMIRTIENKLQDYKERRILLQQEVVRRCEERIEEAKLALGDLSNDIRWPTSNQIDGMFSLRWRFVSIGLPEGLKTVDPEVYEMERVKIQQDLVDSRNVIEEALISGFQEFNQWLLERLTPNEEGKRRKSVKGESLRRFREFLAFLPTRNITGMEPIDVLAVKARRILEGVDSKELIKNEGLADAVRSQFTTIQKNLEMFTEERLSRTITFEEEGA